MVSADFGYKGCEKPWLYGIDSRPGDGARPQPLTSARILYNKTYII
jgi:hypothetical protein